jgi:hypothetical protein
MELFLNLCWLSLLLPAFLLWRQRAGSDSPLQGRALRPIIFLGALACALILLFPVISATDDLHAMRPEMEESERVCRDANRCAGTVHVLHHSSQTALRASAYLIPEFAQIGTILPLLPPTLGSSSVPAPAGRAPPFDRSTSL